MTGLKNFFFFIACLKVVCEKPFYNNYKSTTSELREASDFKISPGEHTSGPSIENALRSLHK